MKYIISVIVYFLFVYGMNLTSGLDLGVVLNLIIPFVFFVTNKTKNIPIYKSVFILFSFLLIDLLASFLYPIIHNTYDFSIVGTKINTLFSFFNTYLIAFSFYKSKKKEKNVLLFLLTILIIQSVIICFSLLYTDIGLQISRMSKNVQSFERMLNYDGARGLGFSSYSAFGIAIIMGVLVLLLFYSKIKNYINTKQFTIILLLSSIASISSGRSSIIGLLLGLCLYVCKYPFKGIRLSVLFIFIYLGFFYLIDSVDIQNSSFNHLYIYIYEPLIKLFEDGSFSTNSTDILRNMYFPISDNTFFLGDGRYTDVSGAYYMNTDAGYMRTILFYGVIMSSLSYIINIYFTISCYRKSQDGDYKALLILILIMSFILQYKGEVILFAQGYYKIIFVLIFFNLFISNDYKKRKLLK